jgi:glycosyltransferase involved in cell wall biosynthesis
MLNVTALILTYNEQQNIGRSITALPNGMDVLIVDSGSSDATLDIARSARPNIKIVARVFDSFAAQCNFGLRQLETEWVLSLDADYILTPELSAAIAALDPPDDVAGYIAGFNYCIHGHRVRSSVYPPRAVLYRRRLAEYRDEGHGHRVQVKGRLLQWNGKIDHDDRKPLSYWIQAQDRYAVLEARLLSSTSSEHLNFQDRLRKKIFFAAPAMFLYLLIGRGLILDGWPGWYYVFQRTIAEMLLSLRLLTERERLEAAKS